MKKAIYIFASVAMALAFSGTSALAGIVGDGTVGTNLTADTSGGFNPIVKAKWEANLDRYTDASTAAGAQILPSGMYQVNKTISMCAVVTDPDGLADIDNVYADVFYPDGVALGDSHVPLSDQSGLGCGLLMQEDTLTRLDKAAGIELFCNQVKNNNNNLPTFTTGYDYAEICATDGELQKDKAAVYCGQKELSYEDPSGDYKVWAVGQDKTGKQGKLENHFTYLPLTAFQTDFTQVAYGNVRLNTHKIISGDLTWNALNTGPASVRNVGNTRLSMKVWQDDMGLGKTSGIWNVKYDARVGSSASYANYFPEVTQQLTDSLDLSELDEMDFSIDISKFPPTHTSESYTGTMTLTAVSAPHLVCDALINVGSDLSAYTAPACDITVSSGESIQANGVDVATVGQTVCVDTGTYTGNVDVNKDVTVVALHAPDSTGKAQINGLVDLTADGATFKGFYVTPGVVGNQEGGITTIASNTTIDSNIVYGMSSTAGGSIKGIYLYKGSAPALSGTLITNNRIENITNSAKGTYGVMVQGVVDNTTVSYNTIKDLSSPTGWGASGVEITPTGSAVYAPKNVVITKNHIDNMGNGTSENGKAVTIDWVNASNTSDASEITLNYNNFVNTATDVRNSDASHTLLAPNNWWGDLSPVTDGYPVNTSPIATSAFPHN